MGKIVRRLLVFALGVPAVGALVLALPFRDHLALSVAVVAFSALGAAEFAAMLAGRGLRIGRGEAAALGAAVPAAALLSVQLRDYPSPLLIGAVVSAVAGWLLLSRVFARGERLDRYAGEVAAGLSCLAYPGMFMAWIVGMTRWDGSGAAILTFLVAVFGGDSLAWLTGILFGKGNRGIVHASPNKSVAGFAGGVLGPVIVCVGAVFILPGVFAVSSSSPIPSAPAAAAVLGLLTGLAAILGDLAESAFKRSSGVKDSGRFMLGRGGVLDSIDSIAVAAPVFFFGFGLLFAGNH